MHLPLKPLILSTLLLLPSFSLGAQPPQAAPAPDLIRCASSELDRQVFRIGKLELRFHEFKPNRNIGRPQIVFLLENSGPAFIPFSLEDLVVVGRDGSQVLEAIPLDRGLGPRKVRIAPGAHVKMTLLPDQQVKFPARLYFGDRLLAEITE